MPVATTVTRSSSVISGSSEVPITTVALSEANALTVLPTVSNSSRRISIPAVMLTNTPRAPARSISSNSGLEIAISAASSARSSPEATPLPIIA